jgi:uncharacterized membrane protein
MPAKTVKKEDKTAAAKRTALNDMSERRFPFTKQNYILMLAGIAILILGYALMVGGRSPNPNEFFPDQVYSWRRITLAPIVVIIGFIVEVYAIMKKPKEDKVLSGQNSETK